jgi:hypothetical protein
VTAVIPDQVGYVSSSGATQGQVDGQKVTFAPVAKVESKQKVEWRLTVKAKKAGDTRLAVELTSDQFKAPIKETESTNLYE